METTIKISSDIKNLLDKMKIHERETYNDIIEVLLEDNWELNDKTKKEIEEARKEIKSGNFISHEEVKKRFGL